MAKITVEEYRKALISLEMALDALDQEQDPVKSEMLKDACIQRFVFSVELAWKISMKSLGLGITAPKPAIREMASNGLIQQPSKWFDFIEARNRSSHTYDRQIAENVMSFVRPFLLEAKTLSVDLTNRSSET